MATRRQEWFSGEHPGMWCTWLVKDGRTSIEVMVPGREEMGQGRPPTSSRGFSTPMILAIRRRRPPWTPWWAPSRRSQESIPYSCRVKFPLEPIWEIARLTREGMLQQVDW